MTSPRLVICATVVSHLPLDARVWREARSLADQGHDVRLIGMSYGLRRTEHRLEHRVRVTLQPFGERGSHGVLRRAIILLRLWARTLFTRADVYHCHNIHPAPGALLAARFRGARLVYDAHELYGEVKSGASLGSRVSARLTRLLERRVARSASAVITTNESRAEVIARRHRLDRVVVVGNFPLRDERLEPLDPGFAQGAATLLYQGGIYAEARAFERTIGALRLLEGVHLEIVGFGRERDLGLIREWAAQAEVADRVHIHPAVPFADLVRIAAAATVGIVPLRDISLNSYLGDTNKLFEYLMAGLPVVGSDFPEVARVLRQGTPVVGAVFDPESEGSIAAAVRETLDHDYAERRVEARRLALLRYNWELEQGKLIRIPAFSPAPGMGAPPRRSPPPTSESLR